MRTKPKRSISKHKLQRTPTTDLPVVGGYNWARTIAEAEESIAIVQAAMRDAEAAMLVLNDRLSRLRFHRDKQAETDLAQLTSAVRELID